MPETKAEAYHRVVREGLWGAASEYRSRVRCRLRKQGLRRDEANEAAWHEMLRQFPPPLPPLKEPDEVWIYCRFEADPNHVQTPRELKKVKPRIRDLWWSVHVVWGLIAALQLAGEDRLRGLGIVIGALQNAPGDEAKLLLFSAIVTPAKFYDTVEASFNRLLSCLQRQKRPRRRTITRAELLLRDLPSVRRSTPWGDAGLQCNAVDAEADEREVKENPSVASVHARSQESGSDSIPQILIDFETPIGPVDYDQRPSHW